MSCDGDDVLCPREHQACPLGQACGSSYSDDPISLRDSAIRLAEAGHIKAATPLFQAVVALTPSKPQGHSDEGVSWMRLKLQSHRVFIGIETWVTCTAEGRAWARAHARTILVGALRSARLSAMALVTCALQAGAQSRR